MGVYPDEHSDFGNPMLSRFQNPDPGSCPVERSDYGIQAPGLAMSHNRYAYCMNNPFMYTDPSGYFFEKWYDFFNPVEYLSAGMQWLNDNTTGLRKKMVDIGVPNFGVGINSTGHTNHYIGDYYVDHNQMRVGNGQAIWNNTKVIFKNGINQDGVNFINNLGVSSDNVSVRYDNAANGGGESNWDWGYSTDAVIATPWGGYSYESGDYGMRNGGANYNQYKSKGNANGAEASVGINIFIILPTSESFTKNDFVGMGNTFSLNIGCISISTSGNSTPGYPENSMFDTYRVIKIGLGLGVGGSNTQSKTKWIGPVNNGNMNWGK